MCRFLEVRKEFPNIASGSPNHLSLLFLVKGSLSENGVSRTELSWTSVFSGRVKEVGGAWVSQKWELES